MRKLLILAIVFVTSHCSAGLAAEAESVSAEVKIDIPVHLKKGNVVFNMDHPSFFRRTASRFEIHDFTERAF